MLQRNNEKKIISRSSPILTRYSLAYSQFIMPLVKSVQEQEQIIEKQNSDIEILKAQIAELTKAVNTLTHK